MNLVDKEHVSFLQVSQQCRDVARLFNRWPGGRTQLGSHFVGDDVSKRGFSQARRPRQQNVIERLAAF